MDIKKKNGKKNRIKYSQLLINQLIIVLATFLFACTQNKMSVVNMNETSTYGINFIETCYTPNADSIFHRFNILNKITNNKEFPGDIRLTEIETVTSDKEITVEGIRKLPLSGGVIPSNIVVSLLVDRSIHDEDMYNIKNAVRYIVDNLPANTTYISFFDNQLRQSKKITADNFDLFDNEFNVSKNNKIIFDAALSKFQELNGQTGLNPDADFMTNIYNDNIKKILVILTDGRVDANNLRTADNIQKFSNAVQKLDDDATNKQRIEIHAIRYGEKNDDVDFTLSYLCVDIRNANVKGGSYFADPVAFIENLKVTDNSIPDYELVMSNPGGKIYQGKKLNTGLTIKKNETTLSGEVAYVVGTIITPIKTGSKNIILQVVFGLIFGLVLLGLSFIFMQIAVPFIRYKFENFNHRYIRIYSFEDDTVIKCHYCLNEIMDGEEIITKCHHTVHKHCWIENGCKCTDYGRNCKRGKQFLYDNSLPFNVNNRPYYTGWAMYGMAGGLISWLIFHIVMYFFPAPFEPLTKGLLSFFYNGNDPLVSSAFASKIGALLFIGLLLGFTLVLFFSMLNKSRQRIKDSSVILILRSLTGAAFVFISFLISAIIFMLCNAFATQIFIDWIPWLLCGCAMGVVLFYRTNTILNQILPGVVLSGILCFLFLLTSNLFGYYSVITGLMLFGAGSGISFISARKIIHKYYLKFIGEKEEKIAIHKWMSVAGGSNEVSIGNSPDATIRMTWDNHPSIKDIQVKLFYHRKNRIPCIKIFSNDVTYNGIFAKNNEEYLLKNGTKFCIGNTVFQYVDE